MALKNLEKLKMNSLRAFFVIVAFRRRRRRELKKGVKGAELWGDCGGAEGWGGRAKGLSALHGQ